MKATMVQSTPKCSKGWNSWDVPTRSSEMHPKGALPKGATTWKGRCDLMKASGVRSTLMWLRRWHVWELPMGCSEIRPKSAATWKVRCEYKKASMVQSTPLTVCG
eukprot:975668-Amphidinium_carterae.1